ncbi:phosphoserine phosphatase, chloroplastic, partial [Tanacetum coccineum]
MDMSEKEAAERWMFLLLQAHKSIIDDVMITLYAGIDELTDFRGARKAFTEWTARAMGGLVPFEETLAVSSVSSKLHWRISRTSFKRGPQ